MRSLHRGTRSFFDTIDFQLCLREITTMKTLLGAILLSTIGFAFADPDVASAFEAAKLKPDVTNEAPKELIEVKYGDKIVDLGNELTPTEVKDVPEVHFKHEGGVLYTLAMTDPDVPTRGYNTEANHWLVGNIPEDKVSKGEVLAEYFGSAPPEGSGLHRYVFLLYKQNQGAITFDERRISARDGKPRLRFSIKKFAEKYKLEGPLAGNFYKAQYDSYVPIARKQIGL